MIVGEILKILKVSLCCNFYLYSWTVTNKQSGSLYYSGFYNSILSSFQGRQLFEFVLVYLSVIFNVTFAGRNLLRNNVIATRKTFIFYLLPTGGETYHS